MAIRNAPEGRATISFSKLQHSLDALTSTQAWDVSGRRLPLHQCQAISPRVYCYLPSSHSRGEEVGDSGKSGGKGGPLGQIPERPGPCQLFPPTASTAERCRPLHSRIHRLRGTGGTKERTRLLPGMEVPRSKFDESSRRRLVRRGARHLNLILSVAAPPSPVCQRGSQQRSVAGSPGSRHSGIASARGRRDRKRNRELFLRLLPHASGAGSSRSCHRLQATNRRGHLHPRPLNPASGACTLPAKPEVRRPEVRGLGPGTASL